MTLSKHEIELMKERAGKLDPDWVDFYTEPRGDELAIGTIVSSKNSFDRGEFYFIYGYHRTWGEVWYWITKETSLQVDPEHRTRKIHPDWFDVIGFWKKVKLDI